MAKHALTCGEMWKSHVCKRRNHMCANVEIICVQMWKSRVVKREGGCVGNAGHLQKGVHWSGTNSLFINT